MYSKSTHTQNPYAYLMRERERIPMKRKFNHALLQVMNAKNLNEVLLAVDNDSVVVDDLDDNFSADDAFLAFREYLAWTCKCCNAENAKLFKRVFDAFDNERDVGRIEFKDLIVLYVLI